MVSENDIAGLPVANCDPDRKGIFPGTIKLRPLEAVIKHNYMQDAHFNTSFLCP
jgi:hypothetical protein